MADGFFVIEDGSVKFSDIVPVVVGTVGNFDCVFTFRVLQFEFDTGHLFDFVVEDFYEDGLFGCLVEYHLEVCGHRDDSEVVPLFVQFGKVRDFCVCNGQLHEGGKREEGGVVAEAESCCDGCNRTAYGVGGDGCVCFVKDVLQGGLCEVEAVWAVDERACAFEAVPPGVLGFPAGNFFFGREEVHEIVGGHFGVGCNFVEERFVHALERCRNFEEPVVELVCFDVVYNVIAVGEELFQERLRVYVFPELVAFVGVGLDFGVVELAPVKGADEIHVAFAGDELGFDFRVQCAEFPHEGGHAHDAASAGTCVGLDVRRDFFAGDVYVLENFREVLVHALGDAFVLVDAHLRQVTFLRGGFGGEHFCVSERLLAEFGELACGIGLGKRLVEIFVFICVMVVTATVAPVMADIERLVACGNFSVFNIYRFRIYQVIAGGVFGVLGEFFVGGLGVHGGCEEKSRRNHKKAFYEMQILHVINIYIDFSL